MAVALNQITTKLLLHSRTSKRVILRHTLAGYYSWLASSTVVLTYTCCEERHPCLTVWSSFSKFSAVCNVNHQMVATMAIKVT